MAVWIIYSDFSRKYEKNTNEAEHSIMMMPFKHKPCDDDVWRSGEFLCVGIFFFSLLYLLDNVKFFVFDTNEH